MEPLTFQQQIEAYATSQVLIMTHGAALVNILFMPEVLLLLTLWRVSKSQGHIYVPFACDQHASLACMLKLDVYVWQLMINQSTLQPCKHTFSQTCCCMSLECPA